MNGSRMEIGRVVAHGLAVLVLATGPLAAQSVLERTPGMSGGWTGYPGLAFFTLPYRLVGAPAPGTGLAGHPTFELGFGLPWSVLGGARFAPGSPTVGTEPDEWEVFVRSAPFSEGRGDAFQLGTEVAYNGAAGSLDGEVSLGRWFGPARLLGAVRTMSDPYDGGEARVAFAAGGVIHPLPGRIPLALSGDVGSLTRLDVDERLAWSAAISLGVSFTSHNLSLFATNTASSTIEGRAVGDERVRYGFEVTAPLPAGRFLGWYADREVAMRAVVDDRPPAARVVGAEAIRYLFLPMQIEITAGTTVEWTNGDAVVHTVAGDDGAWNSGAIRPGGQWSATFTEPGRYPFHCGPHPFMQGVVVVR